MSSHPPIVGSPAAAPRWTTLWPNEAATQAFATALAAALQSWPGGRDARIELRGNLGAGKTTLVRHLLRAAGVQGRIKSPTYAVVEPHQTGTGDAAWPIWHFDFYRFNDPQEWEDAGFRDIFAGPGLKLMEWPDKVTGQLPPPDWVIALEAIDENQRRVDIQAQTPQGQDWLQSWTSTTTGAPHAC
nr:tRNA (adenosine(37)-N6)-threonylcarbamoyltransferase complex ATPase subunit type 1 TsaE [Limnohabitans sp. T6-5]